MSAAVRVPATSSSGRAAGGADSRGGDSRGGSSQGGSSRGGPSGAGTPGGGRSGGGGQSTLNKVARGGSLNVVGAAFAAISGVAVVATVTNSFGKDAAGTFFATTALFVIATSVLQFGAEVGLVRFLPAQVSDGRVEDLMTTLKVALTPVVLLSATGAVGVFVAAPVLAPLVAGPEHAGLVQSQLRVLACFLPAAALYRVVLAATRGFRTMKPTAFVESFGRSGLEIAAAVAVQAAGLGAVALALAWSSSYFIALCVAFVWLAGLLRQFKRRVARERAAARAVPSRTRKGGAQGRAGHGRAGKGRDSKRGPAAARANPQGQPLVAGVPAPPVRMKALAREFWLFTFPRAIATVSQIIVKRLDIVLVAALRSPAEAAIYTAATRFVVIGQLGVQAIQQTLSPHLSALFTQGRTDEARTLYQASTTWAILLAWPIYVSCAVLAPWLLDFFGDGYSGGAPVVFIVACGMLLATASGSVDAVLLMSGRSWLSLVNSLAAVAISVGLNLVLIPRYGVLGAAVAFTAAIATRNLLPLVQIGVFLHMSPLSRASLWAASTAVGSFGLVPGILVLEGASLQAVLGALLGGVLVYAGLTWKGRRLLGLGAFRSALRGRGAGGRRGAQPGSAERSPG